MKNQFGRTLIFVMSISSVLYSQSISPKGTVVKIKFTDEFVDSESIVCNWDTKFHAAFKQNNMEYLVAQESFSYMLTGWGHNTLIHNTTTNESYEVMRCIGCDIYVYGWPADPIPYQFGQGTWLFNVDGNFLINNDGDGFENEANLVYICGKIDNQYFCIDYGINYFFTDLKKSPEIIETEKKYINMVGDPGYVQILKVEQIPNNFVLGQFVWDNQINIFSLKDSTLTYLKPLKEITSWHFENDTLYVRESLGGSLYSISKYNINYNDTTLQNKKLFFAGVRTIDPKFEKAINIISDTLYLYNIRTERIDKQWYIGNLSSPSDPIIGDSEIYIHQTIKTVSIDKNNSTNEILIFALQQNYPNPFNPTTIITYMFRPEIS